jgi:L-malate glycosyltransferase
LLKGRVILIYDSIYGISTHAKTLAAALENLGLNVTEVPVPDVADDKVTILSGFKFLSQLFYSFRLFLRLVKEVKNERSTVVHVHSARLPLMIGYFLHFIGKVPLVFTIHERHSLSLLINRFYLKANRIIAISEELEKQIQVYGANAHLTSIIPNMVDTKKFAPSMNAKILSKPTSFSLLIVGRLDLTKELLIATTIKSMPNILKVFPETILLVIGDGPRLANLSELASTVNLAVGRQAVIMQGRVNNVEYFLKKADIVIGVGRVVIEAMSCGKPIIVASPERGSHLTGTLVTYNNIYDLSKFNFSGRHYSEALDLESLSKIVIFLLKNEQFRETTGQDGRKFVEENLSVDIIAKKTVIIYIKAFEQFTASEARILR